MYRSLCTQLQFSVCTLHILHTFVVAIDIFFIFYFISFCLGTADGDGFRVIVQWTVRIKAYLSNVTSKHVNM